MERGGGGPAETKTLSICLSPSAWHSPSHSRLLRSSVTSVMDEFECNLRPACVVQDPLWSLSGVRTTDRIFFHCDPFSRDGVLRIKKKAFNERISHLGWLNVYSIPVETLLPAILNIAEAFGRRVGQGPSRSLPTDLTHLHVWQWFKELNEALKRTLSSKKNCFIQL